MLFLNAYSYAICVAGVVVGVDNSEVSVGFSDPALEAIELVDLRFLRAYPVGEWGGSVSPRKAT